jgi:hypothetical protein
VWAIDNKEILAELEEFAAELEAALQDITEEIQKIRDELESGKTHLSISPGLTASVGLGFLYIRFSDNNRGRRNKNSHRKNSVEAGDSKKDKE